MTVNLSNLSEGDFFEISVEIDRHESLRDVLAWVTAKPKEHVHPQFVAEVIAQDEFTHDVIVPYRNLFLVYDTT